MREWIANLPLADPASSAYLLRNALLRFSNETLKANERLRLLRVLQPIADRVAEGLRQKIRNHPLPLSQSGSETANLLRGLHRELANGYKQVIAAHDSSKRPGNLTKKELLAALQGAMAYLAELLFDYYRIYQQPEGGIWEDLHQLYRYGEERHLLDTPLPPLTTAAGAETSLKRLYLRTLLLALTSPSRLRQDELEWVHDRLHRWVSHCEMLIPPVHESGLGVLTIDLLADEPATQPAPGEQIAADRYRVLTTIDLLPILRQELIQAHEQGSVEPTRDGGALSPDIYKRLTQAWSSAPQRSFSRSERTSELQVTIGLASIHHFVTLGDVPKGRTTETLELVPEDHPRSPGEYVIESRPGDIWSLAYQSPGEADGKSGSMRSPEAHTCGTINESAGGYCLTTHRESNLRARVGELIAVHRDAASAPWEIGVIRWLRGGDEEWLEFGVQMIAPYARAVEIADIAIREGVSKWQPALLLPEVRAMRQPVSLVVPQASHAAGDSLLLRTPLGRAGITITRLLESTGSFALYQFTADAGVLEQLDL
ncbi:MAG: hypothetical protein Kow006_16010 [Gammaproteobacteria bacterium]